MTITQASQTIKEVRVEYDGKDGRVVKTFTCPYKARSFYVKNIAKNPRVVGGSR